MIGFDAPPERRPDVLAAIACVGYEARPTGRLRLLQTADAARLQQEWRGEAGTVWLNVPVVQVAELPPRRIEAMPAPDDRPFGGSSPWADWPCFGVLTAQASCPRYPESARRRGLRHPVLTLDQDFLNPWAAMLLGIR